MPDGKVNILVAGGCDGWCPETDGFKNVEMYNMGTNQWIPVADLPVPLHSAKMELLGGRPTIIGGFNSNTNDNNGILYQYFVETNDWRAHPNIQMQMPRSSAAVFQVPRDLFQC